MTYARARLWTGISGVGLWVVAGATLLTVGIPIDWFGDSAVFVRRDVVELALVALTCAAIALPFDVLGGYVLPRRFGRSEVDLGGFLWRLGRGVTVVVVLTTASATVLLQAGRSGGRAGALVAFALLAVALLTGQTRLARWVGGLRPSERADADDEAVVLAAEDTGFTGGLSGWSGRSVVPARWFEVLDASERELLGHRRRAIVASGAWRRTWVLALGWNLTGFGLASLVPGAGVATVRELVTTLLGFTLWTFVGLLVLPAVSRAATYAADRQVANADSVRDRLIGALARLDRLQDDEPERSAALESVFHPVSSLSNRRAALASGAGRRPFAWHLARTSLILAHVGLSPLPRAVHCNAGRPELWLHLPADG